jgi:hypothetical protein
MLGLINLLLLILISAGIMVLVAGYTKGRQVEVSLISPAPAEVNSALFEQVISSGENGIFEPYDSIFYLFIANSLFYEPDISSNLENLYPEQWMEWPVVPFVSERAKEIYWSGIARGNNPHAFSIIGDSQSAPSLFMGIYDTSQYQLTEGSQNLQETIANFSGSFSRWGPAVIDGGTPATVLARSWSIQKGCDRGETPLDCELRIHRPVIVFVNLGTHWTDRNPEYLRQIVQVILEYGAVPILATKADNLEGNFENNLGMARISKEYEVPLWNFWAVVQDLPHSGLDPVKKGGYMYLTAEGLARRQFSALQVLDAVRRALNEE